MSNKVLSMMSFNEVTINLSVAQLDYLSENFFGNIGIFDLNQQTVPLVFNELLSAYTYYRLIEALPLQNFAFEIIEILRKFVPNSDKLIKKNDMEYQKQKKYNDERNIKVQKII